MRIFGIGIGRCAVPNQPRIHQNVDGRRSTEESYRNAMQRALRQRTMCACVCEQLNSALLTDVTRECAAHSAHASTSANACGHANTLENTCNFNRNLVSRHGRPSGCLTQPDKQQSDKPSPVAVAVFYLHFSANGFRTACVRTHLTLAVAACGVRRSNVLPVRIFFCVYVCVCLLSSYSIN